jgi:hypothetical protein
VARVAIIALLVAAVAAGCGRRASSELPITSREWNSVVDDWLAHGKFSTFHSCASAVVARSRVAPAFREGMPLVHALDLYEKRVCTPGNVWAVKVGMSDRQVTDLAGAPIPWMSGPHCWFYRATQSGTSVDGRGFCFSSSGRVSAIKIAVHG